MMLPKNQFARGVGMLIGGTAGAQLVTILAAPLLTRLYSPEDFGVLAVYVGLIGILGTISSLRYEIAIPLPKSETSALNIVVLCICILLAVTFVLSLSVIIYPAIYVSLVGVQKLDSYIWLLPVGVFLSGIYFVFHYWAIRKKNYSKIAQTRLIQSFSAVIVQVVAFRFGGVTLLIGHAIGLGLAAYKFSSSLRGFEVVRKIKARKISAAARRYKNFPLYSTWTGFFSAAGDHLPPIIFSSFFSSDIAGFYALAHRVISLPSAVIGQAVASVFLSHAPDARRKGTLDNLILRVVDALSRIAAPAAIFLIINSEYIFAVVFGESWSVAGSYAAILTPMLLLGFITSPVTTLCAVLDRQVAGTIFQASMLAVRVLSIIIGVHFSSIVGALFGFSISSALCYLVFLFWLVSAAGGGSRQVVTILLSQFSLSLPILFPLFLFPLVRIEQPLGSLVLLILSFLITLIIYAISYGRWKKYVPA